MTRSEFGLPTDVASLEASAWTRLDRLTIPTNFLSVLIGTRLMRLRSRMAAISASGVFLGGGDDIVGHDLLHALSARFGKFCGKRRCRGDGFDPPRMVDFVPISSRFMRSPSLTIPTIWPSEHRQRTDVVLGDELRCIGDGVFGSDRNDVTDHYIHCSHDGVHPLFYSENFAE
jgi:hypothetical protein